MVHTQYNNTEYIFWEIWTNIHKDRKKWQNKEKEKRKNVLKSFDSFRQFDERHRRNRCTLKNSPTVKDRNGEKSKKAGRRLKWRTARKKSKMRTMDTRKRDFTVLGHLPKNERGEDRGRLKNIHLSFVCMNVSFLILLVPDYRSFPTACVLREIRLYKYTRYNNASVFRYENQVYYTWVIHKCE